MTAQTVNCPLTPTEQKIVQMLADNDRAARIAHQLGIAENSVNKHTNVAKIRAGIPGASLAHLVAVSIRNGWVQ